MDAYLVTFHVTEKSGTERGRQGEIRFKMFPERNDRSRNLLDLYHLVGIAIHGHI